MSVYKRPGAKTYSYDFHLGGRRFLGGTGKASKREAEAYERIKREEAKQEITTQEALDKPRTWELAASRWFEEVGQHHKNVLTTLANLEWLTRHIGRQTLLADIDDNFVAGLVSKRRNEFRQVGKPENRTKKVGPATVNRTMTEPLRKVLLRAAKTWKVKVGDVDWSQHMLDEPRERVREASQGEEAVTMDGLERGYDEAVAFAFRDGCRRMEICGLKWPKVDFFGRQYTVIGKRGKERTIPMSQATFDQLWRLRGQHEEFVFTFVAARTRRHGAKMFVRGQRYPIQPERLSKVLKAAALSGGVQNFRMHDTRHTAATRVLRKSNLRVAQVLLGHENVATTTKYAHALAEDVRAALDAASSTSPTAQNTASEISDADKSLKGLGKAG